MSASRQIGKKTSIRTRLARWLWRPGSDSGTALVEFGLVFPMFLALVFGIMEGGRVMFTQAVMSYATQSATRWSVVNPQASGQTLADYEQQIEDYAKSKLILISPNHVATAAATSPTDPTDNTRTITITLSYDFEWLMPFVSDATGPFQISASSSGFLAENF